MYSVNQKSNYVHMNNIISFLCLFFFLSFNVIAREISITDFGINPNSFEDAIPALNAAIEACKQDGVTKLSFPTGRYDFWPDKTQKRDLFISNTSSEVECPSKIKNVGLLLEGFKNITIEGNGSLFVFHGKMITFSFDHCENITLQNVSMDFERPSMSELTFIDVNDSIVVASVHPDSDFTIIDGHLKWYGEGWGMKHYHAILVNPFNKTMTYNSWNPFLNAKAKEIEPRVVRFEGNFKRFGGQAGTTLTIRDPIRDHVGAFINHSKNIVLDNVSMHYMHGLGIVNQFSENLKYTNVRITPREESGRKIATFADCIHFSGCKGEITIENCLFNGAHDDPINVHGTHLKITEIVSPKAVKVRFMHHQSYGFEAFFANDSIAVVRSSSLKPYASNVVETAKLISERVMLVEMKNPLPKDIIVGDCLENVSWNPSLTIKGCLFTNTNTRGILITTRGNVVIEDNKFINTGMHAILIANDAESWYESGPVKNVRISNNLFENCAYNSSPNYIINIAPENHEYDVAVHENIQIINNVFKVYDAPLVSAKSTNNIVFEGNTIIKNNDRKPQNPSISHFNLNACKHVKIRDNKVQGIDNMKVSLNRMEIKDILTDLKDITVNSGK